jgi:hypothetical protein
MAFKLKFSMSDDLYERHAVVSRLVRGKTGDNQEDVCILDVGGRAELLEQFLPYRVVSVNVDRSGDLLGDGCTLPFMDSSFIAVVSIDTLEHLPQEWRLPFLQECLRVAQHCVVVAAPFGSEGHKACEKQLNDLHRSVVGHPHIYLSEHIRYGLPGPNEIDLLARNLEGASVKRFFAGDYMWQNRQFERAVLANREQGWGRYLLGMYNRITAMALFHPVRLREHPDARTNRFYLLIEKRT